MSPAPLVEIVDRPARPKWTGARPNGPGPAGAPASRAGRWLADEDNLVFVLLLIVCLIPLWAFPFFGSQDGPAHLHNAAVIAEYSRPDRSVLRDFYLLKPRLEPNLLGHLVLAALLTVASPLVAEKLLLTAYVVLFVLAVRYALRALDASSPHVGLLAFPLVYGYAVYMGFYNYALGVPLFLLAVGYWYRHRESFSARRVPAFAGLLFLLYLAHLLTLGLALLAIAILAAGPLFAGALRRGPGGDSGAPRVRGAAFRTRALFPLLAALPVLYLTLEYLARAPGSRGELPAPGEVLFRVAFLFGFGGVVSLSVRELVVVGLLSSLLLGSTILCLRAKLAGREAWHRGDLMLGVAAAFTAFYLLVPEQMAGGSYVWPRLGVPVFLAALLWLGTQSFVAPGARPLRVAAVVLTLTLLAIRTPAILELNAQLAEYRDAAAHVEENSTLLSLGFSHAGRDAGGQPIAYLVKPFLHAAGYIAAERGAVLVNNYEGSLPYFPVQFRPSHLPDPYFGPQDARTPPRADLAGYAARTGAPIDYVLFWDLREDDPVPETLHDVMTLLATEYRLAHRSPGSGRVRLYRHADAPGSHALVPGAAPEPPVPHASRSSRR